MRDATLISGEMLSKSCTSVYGNEDIPRPGCAQKYLLVWVSSGNDSILQVSSEFLSLPWPSPSSALVLQRICT